MKNGDRKKKIQRHQALLPTPSSCSKKKKKEKKKKKRKKQEELKRWKKQDNNKIVERKSQQKKEKARLATMSTQTSYQSRRKQGRMVCAKAKKGLPTWRSC